MMKRPVTRAVLCVFALSMCVLGGCSEHAHDGDNGHSHDGGDSHARESAQVDDDHGHGGEDDAAASGDLHARGESTRIPADVAEAAGVRVAPVEASTIRKDHVVQGLLVPIEGRSARIVARFPGPVRAVNAATGDVVRKGQTLAVVESNISLSNYSVVAPIAGTVLSRSVAVGDLAGEAPMFEIADLSSLWVDLHLFGADGDHIVPGLSVSVERLSDGERVQIEIERVLPGAATASQSTVARAIVPNVDGRWRAGAAVRARVTLSEREAAIVVPLPALQRYEGRDVVFVRQDEDRYEVRAVTLGERDAERVEVLSGLKSGEDVVVEQSYLIKADIEKAGAAHEH
jgi:cobalt-zinc-cadmium efflux system membrane fusion protein